MIFAIVNLLNWRRKPRKPTVGRLLLTPDSNLQTSVAASAWNYLVCLLGYRWRVRTTTKHAALAPLLSRRFGGARYQA
jgi:hypothetical protein